MDDREVIYYKNESGRCFVKEFIDSLSPKTQSKVFWTLKLLRESSVLKRPYFGNIETSDGIREVIVDSGSNTFRILFFFDGGNIVVLTNGFIKKTEKTPQAEIKKSETYKKDYLERKK